MAIIRIKNLLIRTIIGFKPYERNNRQDVLINMEIKTDIIKAVKYDKPDEILDYKVITKRVIKLVHESSFNLLESLAHKILMSVMEDEKVAKCIVEVDKPHALRFSESVSVAVSAERDEHGKVVHS